ncbi:MAG: DUF4105 domain-containing protein [Bacteroidota bacterium]
MKKLFILLLFVPMLLAARPLSNQARVSLITCAPGNEIYSAFGHSAIRVYDPVNRIDMVYGYGTFDFSDPMFLPKFIQRDLMYFLDVDQYPQFKYVYEYFQRSFDEQVFDLDSTQNQRIFDFLENNMRPENRFYLYDFFFDNCATRIRDVVYNELEGELIIPDKDKPSEFTFRDILDQYLGENPWMDFGIDLAIGAVVDVKATPWEQTFHPDYLSSVLASAQFKDGRPLVASNQNLYDAPSPITKGNPFTAPLTMGILALLAVGFFSWKNREVAKEKFVGDGIFFSILGIGGLLLLFLWFGTDHIATKQNWNLLWFLPTHIVAGVLLFRKSRPSWLSKYFLASGGLAVLLLLGWYIIPQSFHIAFIPILLIIALRSWVLYNKL